MSKSTKRQKVTKQDPQSNRVSATPRSLAIFASGIQNDKDFAAAMSTLMGDLIEGTVTPAVGNSVCKAGSNLLKIVEMKYKYGTQGDSRQKEKTLKLASI